MVNKIVKGRIAKGRGKLLHILFKGEVMKVVDRLQKSSGSDSKAEVVRDALRLYEILDQISKKGSLIVMDKEGKDKRLVTLPRKRPTIS